MLRKCPRFAALRWLIVEPEPIGPRRSPVRRLRLNEDQETFLAMAVSGGVSPN